MNICVLYNSTGSFNKLTIIDFLWLCAKGYFLCNICAPLARLYFVSNRWVSFSPHSQSAHAVQTAVLKITFGHRKGDLIVFCFWGERVYDVHLFHKTEWYFYQRREQSAVSLVVPRSTVLLIYCLRLKTATFSVYFNCHC